MNRENKWLLQNGVEMIYGISSTYRTANYTDFTLASTPVIGKTGTLVYVASLTSTAEDTNWEG